MTDNAERVKLVCQRAKKFKEKREQKKITVLKFTSAALTALTIFSISIFSDRYQSGTVTDHYGTILLADGMGGYVLTAVVTFIAATVITVLCIKIKNRRNQK